MLRIRSRLFSFSFVLYLETNSCIISLIEKIKNQNKPTKQTKNPNKQKFLSSSKLVWTAPELSVEYYKFPFFLFKYVIVDII